MKYVFPAIFAPEPEGVYSVTFPDLPGCATFGETIQDAIEMGRDALSLWLCDAEKNNEPIPHPSDLPDIECDIGFVNLVDCDTDEYRRINDNRAIKKTLTIPSWLNAQAEKAGVNFSQILQDALKNHLGIKNP